LGRLLYKLLGAWLIRSCRTQFSAKIQESGVDGMIQTADEVTPGPRSGVGSTSASLGGCGRVCCRFVCEPREITMAFRTTREALSRIFYQRCFWLFVVLLTLIGAMSFVPASDSGRLILNVVNMFLVIATVAAVGRTTLSFVITLILAIPAMWFQYLGLWHDDDSSLAVSWIFSAVLYFITVAYLLRYVFQPRIMTADKLFGAAAAYLLIGVLWA
jgi:hypothetical protein